MQSHRFLRLNEVQSRLGIKRSTVYRWVSLGQFPHPVKLGERVSAWRESDILEWEAKLSTGVSASTEQLRQAQQRRRQSRQCGQVGS
jgi:prophage regulatory protein